MRSKCQSRFSYQYYHAAPASQNNNYPACLSAQLHTLCPSLTFLTFNCHFMGEVMEE